MKYKLHKAVTTKNKAAFKGKQPEQLPRMSGFAELQEVSYPICMWRKSGAHTVTSARGPQQSNTGSPLEMKSLVCWEGRHGANYPRETSQNLDNVYRLISLVETMGHILNRCKLVSLQWLQWNPIASSQLRIQVFAKLRSMHMCDFAYKCTEINKRWNWKCRDQLVKRTWGKDSLLIHWKIIHRKGN